MEVSQGFCRYAEPTPARYRASWGFNSGSRWKSVKIRTFKAKQQTPGCTSEAVLQHDNSHGVRTKKIDAKLTTFCHAKCVYTGHTNLCN